MAELNDWAKMHLPRVPEANPPAPTTGKDDNVSPANSGASSLYEGKDQDGIVFGPQVRSWEGWPDDVRETLRAWNRAGSLSFPWAQRVFECPDCHRYIDNRGTSACELNGTKICDDCIVALVRGVAA